MNKAKLREMDGRHVRVYPTVERVWIGQRLPLLDQAWRVEISREKKPFMRLVSVRSGHCLEIYEDGVQEFREPDVLWVKDQFTITERGIRRRPVPDRRAVAALRRRYRRTR